MGKQDLNQYTVGIVARAESETADALRGGDPAEAKRALTTAIRDLRDYKRELTASERSIREQFQEARLKTRQSGQVIGMVAGSKARGAMSRARAIEGRSLSARQADALQPYGQAKLGVDRAISHLNRMKAQLTAAPTSAAQPASAPHTANEGPVAFPAAPASPPPLPPTPAMWAADPSGRHEYRYWDGAQWTDQVADHGTQLIDPLT